jgi:hypothetical protein
MSDAREDFASVGSVASKPHICTRRQPRILAFLGTAVGLLAALNLAPVALGQSQSTTPSAAPAPAPAAVPAQTKAPSQSEPPMQDQSAPAQDSLAEAARKAKAHKTNSATPKVYTEDKLSGLSGHGVSSVGSGSSGGASTGSENSYANSGGNAGASSGKNDEQYWRGRAQGIRDQMAQLDQQIAGIQEEIKAKGAVTIDPMSGASAGVIYVEDRNRQIKDIEGQKAKLQEQLEALAEDGRKAGADSGWFR